MRALLVLLLLASTASAVEVAVLGDETRHTVASQLPAKSIRTTRAADVASLLHSTDVAVLVVDVTQGLMPTHRSQLIAARGTSLERLMVVLSNHGKLLPEDARELAALVTLETRELAAKYRFTNVPVFVDTEIGLKALHKALAENAPSRRPLAAKMVPKLTCEVYVLNKVEADGRETQLTNGDAVEVWT